MPAKVIQHRSHCVIAYLAYNKISTFSSFADMTYIRKINTVRARNTCFSSSLKVDTTMFQLIADILIICKPMIFLTDRNHVLLNLPSSSETVGTADKITLLRSIGFNVGVGIIYQTNLLSHSPVTHPQCLYPPPIIVSVYPHTIVISHMSTEQNSVNGWGNTL